MKKRPRKLLCFIAVLLTLFLFAVIPAFADTGESTLQISGEPAKLILQLGPGWAGAQFELRTDAGMYPGPVVVGEDGVLRMDLGGSKTFTLSRVQGAAQGNTVAPPVNNAMPAVDVPATGTTPGAAVAPSATDATAPTTDVDLDAFLAALTESGTEVPAEQPVAVEEPAEQGVPTKHILLFGVGILAAVAALVILSRLKKRRTDDDEEDDYE